jgi:hypothetical protein
LYDPASGTWTATGSLNTARYQHTATLLPNGMVLVVGGFSVGAHASASAELYDSTSGTWTTTGTLATARWGHTATLLPNGMVLVAGGYNGTNYFDPSGYLASTELYDSASGTWTTTGSLNTARLTHTATLLSNGTVLVAAGRDSTNNPSASAELYDPVSGTWTDTGSLITVRRLHTATLLPNGMVLVAGGYNSVVVASAELYDIGLEFIRPEWQPQIAPVTSPLISGSSLALTGSRFEGISQASGGNFQDSSTNYPLVQLRNIDSSQVAFLPVNPASGWSDTSFTSTPVTNFPVGPALVTVFTNGIPSDSKYLIVATLVTISPSASPSAGGTTSGDGTYASGASVTAKATPTSGYTFTNWTENGSIVSYLASYSFALKSNRTLVANFTTNPVTITTSASPSAGGTVSGGGTYASGASVTVSATAKSGYVSPSGRRVARW